MKMNDFTEFRKHEFSGLTRIPRALFRLGEVPAKCRRRKVSPFTCSSISYSYLNRLFTGKSRTWTLPVTTTTRPISTAWAQWGIGSGSMRCYCRWDLLASNIELKWGTSVNIATVCALAKCLMNSLFWLMKYYFRTTTWWSRRTTKWRRSSWSMEVRLPGY